MRFATKQIQPFSTVFNCFKFNSTTVTNIQFNLFNFKAFSTNSTILEPNHEFPQPAAAWGACQCWHGTHHWHNEGTTSDTTKASPAFLRCWPVNLLTLKTHAATATTCASKELASALLPQLQCRPHELCANEQHELGSSEKMNVISERVSFKDFEIDPLLCNDNFAFCKASTPSLFCFLGVWKTKNSSFLSSFFSLLLPDKTHFQFVFWLTHPWVPDTAGSQLEVSPLWHPNTCLVYMP